MKHLKRFNEGTSEYVGNNQSDYSVTITIPQTIINICKKHNIDEEQYVTLFENYISHLVGDIYGTEADDFGRWCEESDNISDYQYPDGFDSNGPISYPKEDPNSSDYDPEDDPYGSHWQ